MIVNNNFPVTRPCIEFNSLAHALGHSSEEDVLNLFLICFHHFNVNVLRFEFLQNLNGLYHIHNIHSVDILVQSLVEYRRARTFVFVEVDGNASTQMNALEKCERNVASTAHTSNFSGCHSNRQQIFVASIHLVLTLEVK